MKTYTEVRHRRTTLYIVGFLFAIFSALPTYINSSFLEDAVGDRSVGTLYALGSLVSFVAFLSIARILRRIGDYRLTLSLLIVSGIATAILAIVPHPIAIALAFIVAFASIAIIAFDLDIFLEHSARNAETGRVRGAFFTWANIGWVISPIISGFLLERYGFHGLYLIVASLVIPTMLVLTFGLRRFRDPRYHYEPFSLEVREAWRDRNLRASCIIHFILQFFYAWMIIYTPIYLHETIGFDWQTIGIMFSVMLIPFVVVGRPLGALADKFIGEKELIITGCAVAGISTLAIAFTTDHNAILWGAILFATRIGASTIEIMTDTYFFKQVSSRGAHLIGFYRSMRPLSYLIAPLIATILLGVLDLPALFVILGFLMLYGIRYAVILEDTK